MTRFAMQSCPVSFRVEPGLPAAHVSNEVH